MNQELNHICTLLCSSKDNEKVAFQILKGNPNLKDQVDSFFQSTLNILNQKSLKAIASLATKIRNRSKLSSKEESAIAQLDFLYKMVEHVSIVRKKEIPILLKKYSNLNSIELKYCSFKELPIWINQLVSLKEFSAYECKKVSSLPESIGQLTNLTTFQWQWGKLNTLPQSIGNWVNLKKFTLNSNVKSLPDGIKNWTNLWLLNLDNNQLTTLPKSIGELKNLSSFNLFNNQIISLPDSIENLIALKSLRMNTNQLSTLPNGIGGLKSLENLSCEANQIVTLPDSIRKLKALKSLNLAKNKLTTLPDSISELSQLENLYLQNNPLSDSEKERIRQLLPNSSITF